MSIASDLRVLVVADNPFARAGIASLLNAQDGFQIVGQISSDGLLEQIQLFATDVWIWELPYDAAQSANRLADLRDIAAPALILLGDNARAGEAIAAGARGILPQNADAETIAAALLALSHDLIVMSPDLQPDIPQPTLPIPLFDYDALTEREYEVLALVAEGLPNKQIALRLSISEHTVKFHVNAIMGKLNVQSRTEAVVRATRLGLIAL